MDTIADVIDTINEENRAYHSSYDTLTPVYDFINSDHFNYQHQEELVSSIVDNTDSLVELGCGTGQLLSRIQSREGQLIGIDLNRRMLDRATERAPRASLIQGDVRDAVLSGTVSGVAMLGRVFSKMLTDECVQSLACSIETYLENDGQVVFNTFRRDQLVDGLSRTQRWESDRFTVVRYSETELLFDVRDGLMCISMDYDLFDKKTDKRTTASEQFRLRGYDTTHIESLLNETTLSVNKVNKNDERSTQFVFLQRE